jgi:Holliday junction resolvasome RuvABC DNA-binding subunit
MAKRIVTELRDRLDDVVAPGVTTFAASVQDGAGEAGDAMATFYEAREALVGLGMSIPEAEAALAGTDGSAGAGERVKQALATRQVRG